MGPSGTPPPAPGLALDQKAGSTGNVPSPCVISNLGRITKHTNTPALESFLGGAGTRTELDWEHAAPRPPPRPCSQRAR